MDEIVNLDIEDPAIFRTLFIHNPDMTYITDLKGNIIEVNKSTYSITGFTKDEIIGADISSFINEEEIPGVLSAFQQVLKGRAKNTIFSIFHKKGHLLKVNNISIPVYKDKQIIGAIGISKDITREENLKETLELQNQKYKSLFDYHPDAIYTLDPEGNFSEYNDSLEELLGGSPEYLSGSFRDVIAEEYLDTTVEHFQKALQGSPQTYHSVGVKRDHDLVDVQVTNVPIKVNGQIKGVFGIAKDITSFIQQQRELEKIKDSLNRAQMVANIGSLEYDVEKDRGFWSLQLFRIFGIDPQEGFVPTFDAYLGYIHPEDRTAFKIQFNRLLNEKRSAVIECRILRKDGQERYIQHKASFLDEHQFPKIVATVQDITEKRQIEEKLYENERKIAQIYENLDVGIYSADLINRKVLHFSRGVVGIFGYTAEDFITDFELWNRIILPEDRPGVSSEREKLKEGKSIRYQYRILHKSGEQKWVNVDAIPILNEEGELIQADGFVADITESKRLEEKMRHMAFHDYLTGLPNRRSFDEKLNSLLETGTQAKFAVMFFEMERLKHINDTLGNAVGDELLKQVSQRIVKSLKGSQMAARINGDEFAIIMEGFHSIEEPTRLAQEITRSTSNSYIIDSYELYINSTIGISIYPNNGKTAEEIIRNADAALYHAKQRGKNSYQVYNSSMDIQAYKLFTLERDMREALKNNELYLEYQPRVDTKTGRILSAEALIRWNHPDWGRVSPAEFIPVAEESGLILDIGDYVIWKVCEKIQEWKKKGLHVVPISVNISPQRFLKNDLVSVFKSAVTQHGIEPNLIELELTESSLINYSENVISALTELGEMGVKIALDDFGTGYSSITQLKQYKFDVLKIDKSFIQNMDKSPEDTVITANLIQLAHGLNMEVVAEGVETFEQYQFLRQKECDQIQGFLFSKPLPHNIFEQKLAAGMLKPKDAQRENVFKKLRKFFRVEFPYPLGADMTILKLNNKKVEMGTTEILIEDMGPGGVKFLSPIKLPVRQDIILKIETEILGETVSFTGFIVWKEEISDTLNNYGFQFILDENQRSELVTMLNKLQIQLKKHSMVPECRFIQISSSHMYFD
ncbi:EAL domain-containing protein [Bacillus sp. ISL-47]|uniref:EAL domain-containing protein n=1 Tax=Bacillus sp. ISL-47 TaxID=2819130 RepID=UPI001BE6D3F7|nr:EAL domain-containing protein [Bacillus sp. ISL-47]